MRWRNLVEHQKKQEKEDSFEIVSVDNLNNTDKALLEYGKNVILNSVETIKSFAQSMITLISGLFAVYFALLEFLGKTSLQTSIIALPPVLFIASLIVFVVAILPLPGTLALNVLSDIERDRKTTIMIKYIASILGMGFLVTGLTISVVVFL